MKNQSKRLQEIQRKKTGVPLAEQKQLSAEIVVLQSRLPDPLPTIPATWNDARKRTEIHVLKRGVWENKGQRVGPRPLSVLVPDDLPELPPDVSDPRTRLARWLTSPDHPLTARVLANRLWQQHFGAGLVKTANDFGTKGDRPSHPELLDWLAATLVEHGWRLKPVHRLLVLSQTYRQSSRATQATEADRSDPENRLLWKFNRRRLSAEEVRDTMLAVSGRLNPKAGGPSVMVPIDSDLVELLYEPAQWRVASEPSEHDRRSIYLLAKRNLRIPFFETFDGPAPMLTSCPRRESSTHAAAGVGIAQRPALEHVWPVRLPTASNARRAARRRPQWTVPSCWLSAGRRPSSNRSLVGLEFLQDQPWTERFALAVFNLNGFLYAFP